MYKFMTMTLALRGFGMLLLALGLVCLVRALLQEIGIAKDGMHGVGDNLAYGLALMFSGTIASYASYDAFDSTFSAFLYGITMIIIIYTIIYTIISRCP